jgi:short-subunit dehydrogenase
MNCLITGGNRGIGKEFCKQLALAGNRVFLGSRSLEDGINAINDIKRYSPDIQIQTLQLDVTSINDVQKAYNFLRTEILCLDLLINNAAIMHGSNGVHNEEITILKEAMETNLFGPIRMCQAFLPLLYTSSMPLIVNISSEMGLLSDKEAGGYGAYRLSKSSLNAFTAHLAFDVNNTHVKVIAVCPGWVQTDMGGQNANRTPEISVKEMIHLMNNRELISGKFYRFGEQHPW